MARLQPAALVIGAFVGALVLSGIGGCNIHELGHLVTGRIAGVPVEDVLWCAPGSGRVVFAYQEPPWVGYAGGLTAALVLVGAYRWLLWPRLSSPVWWAAGVAVLGTVISQTIVALLEGSSPVRYGELQDETAGLALIFIVPLATAAALQWRWRRPVP